ncbi:chemotaxis protein [Vibrio sp. WXL103]|uniref:chemotaxis protein n=1 Tax=unclassified Vibrio TaxID=2614977 RepID=UPI003EC67EB5
MVELQTQSNQAQGMLMFTLNSQQQRFAIGTLKVREIVPYLPTTQIPYSHPNVIGTVSIRDKTVPVIDMPGAIGFRPIQPEEYESCYLIVTDCLRSVVAFMVRSIEKIIECDWRAIEPAPRSAGHHVFVTGIARFDDQLVQMLDIELLLSKIYPQLNDTSQPIVTDIEREQLRRTNILLVDDSAIARKQLANALGNLAIPYQMATNGADGLERMREAAAAGNPFDVLVSDIEMPGLDGYELVFAVQNSPELRHCYRILHTSLSSEISVERANQVGAHQALEKFNAAELVSAMLEGAQKISDQTLS